MSTMTKTVAVRINGGDPLDAELTIDNNSQTMWSEGPRPDPKWTFTDREGHEHQRGEDGRSLPTLRVELEHIPCDGTCGDPGCEGVNVPHYFCPTCGEEIEPGLLHGPYQFTVDGPKTWHLIVRDDEQIRSLNERVTVTVFGEYSEELSGEGVVVGVDRSRGVGGEITGSTTIGAASELVETRARDAEAEKAARLRKVNEEIEALTARRARIEAEGW